LEIAVNDLRPKYYGELHAVNFDGSKSERIFGVRAYSQQTGTLMRQKAPEHAWAEIIDRLPDDPDHILISSTPWSDAIDKIPRVKRINIYTGLDRGVIK